MVCGYKCSCLKKLTPFMSGYHHLYHFLLYLFIFAKLLGRTPLVRDEQGLEKKYQHCWCCQVIKSLFLLPVPNWEYL